MTAPGVEREVSAMSLEQTMKLGIRHGLQVMFRCGLPGLGHVYPLPAKFSTPMKHIRSGFSALREHLQLHSQSILTLFI